jgi:hypothetical protein
VFVEPPVEFRERLGMREGDLLQLWLAGHGTVHARRSWLETVKKDFQGPGLKPMETKPFLWGIYDQGQLQGLALVHMDDFIFTGSERNPKY